ncbi:hypothetical protein [Noviherbaspirillum pedocola]|uniref:Uncharacterized protein n=1 Tax=Noviherbaspirillum pedocola TaxID=2801341 RepID=A0A934SU26_9BURK|nr:hypothetical protein [Noviherbaspirillum pedocola]MBK4736801.1 hypothetical protein [Noviherbaspirillum pedocola]
MKKSMEYAEKVLVDLVGREYLEQLIAATAPAPSLANHDQDAVGQDGLVGEWHDAPATSQPGLGDPFDMPTVSQLGHGDPFDMPTVSQPGRGDPFDL